jgi:transcriptional regulator with GAF, ATPase, and Fis domain
MSTSDARESRHGDTRPRIVAILSGGDPDRVRSLADTVGGRAEIVTIDDAASAVRFQTPAALCIGVVHLGSAEADPGLATIRALKDKSIRIIACGDRLESWPLGARCRALLAGADSLVDNSHPQFASRLWARIVSTCDAEARYLREREDVRLTFWKLGIVGRSEAIRNLFRWTLRVSRLSDLHVLISGETGTGKQLLAEAIHRLDPKRRDGPFVAVNCAAISPALAESELFGHRRGAFTGADRERKGLIRAADGGILLLDEIGELVPAHQAKILRMLQSGRVLSVGDDHEVPIDVRVIAATNRNLEEMVAAGTFRADLFHRLHMLSIHIAPLRDRREDVQPLVEYFLGKHHHLRIGTPLVAGTDFVDALKRADLPGNAREVENIVRHAIAHNEDGAPLTLSDLPAKIWSHVSELESRAERVAATTTETSALAVDPAIGAAFLWHLLSSNGWSLSRSLASCERSLVERALRSSNGNQARAARLLGMTPRTIYNKLRKYKQSKQSA